MSRFLTTAPALADQRYREGLAVFDYDTGLPLDVRGLEAPAAHVGDIRRYEITYRSPMGGRVPASLMIPRTAGSAPALVLQHGLPGSHDDMAPLGYEIAGLGATVIMIDAPWARPGSDARFTGITFSPEDRANQIQLIVDLRRAVDLLTGLPHVAGQRIAYLGVSYGGAMGGLLAGVERRIGSFVLEVGDGGLVTHVTGPEDAGAGFFDLSSRERRRWLTAME
ncbi:MAG TPA: alpha/beta fold hydrolase, partial [Actinomycetota bacterium]|nr:alpha/beta fold hydrolase [Actinomycetota bacterium]